MTARERARLDALEAKVDGLSQLASLEEQRRQCEQIAADAEAARTTRDFVAIDREVRAYHWRLENDVRPDFASMVPASVRETLDLAA